MTVRELLDVIGATATYEGDDDLASYKVVAVTTPDRKEHYKVRGVWLDHENRHVTLSLSRSRSTDDDLDDHQR